MEAVRGEREGAFDVLAPVAYSPIGSGSSPSRSSPSLAASDSFAMAFLSLLIVVWFLLGLVLLIDCVRSKRVLPLFGSRVIARIVWAASFLFFSPLQAALYFVFGSGRVGRMKQERLRDAIVMAGLLIIVGAQYGFGRWSFEAMEVKANGVSSKGASPAWTHSWNVRMHGSNSRSGTGTSGFWSPVACRRIRVVASEDMISRAAAVQVAEAFAAEWWTDEVELWPRHQRAEEGALAPDLYIDIDAGDVEAIEFPIAQWFRGRAQFTCSPRPHLMGATRGALDSRVKENLLDMEGELTISFRRFGTALGASRYGEPAEAVSDLVRSSVIEPLRERVDLCGRAPDSPLTRSSATPMPMPAALEAAGAVLLDREHSRYVRSRARYRFDDSRATKAVLDEIAAALETEGWGRISVDTDEGPSTVLAAGHDRARLTIGRWPAPPWSSPTWVNGERLPSPPEPPSTIPFMATLVEFAADEELDAMVAEGLRDPVDVVALLPLRRRLDPPGMKRLREAWRAEPVPRIGYWLTLANLEAEAGDPAAALAALRLADALAACERFTGADSAIAHRAEKLEIELDDEPVTFDRLVEAGYAALVPGGPAASASLVPGQTARFVAPGKDGLAVALLITPKSLDSPISFHYRSWHDNSWLETSWKVGADRFRGAGDRWFQAEGESRDGRAELEIRCVE